MAASCKKQVSWAPEPAVPIFFSPHLPINASELASPTARTTHHASPHFWTTISYKKSPRVSSKVQSFHSHPRARQSHLQRRCFRCLGSDHLLRDCREPLRCLVCKMLGHSSASCRRRLRDIESSSPLPRASPPNYNSAINQHTLLASAMAPLGTFHHHSCPNDKTCHPPPPSPFKRPIMPLVTVNHTSPIFSQTSPHPPPTGNLSFSVLHPFLTLANLSVTAPPPFWIPNLCVELLLGHPLTLGVLLMMLSLSRVLSLHLLLPPPSPPMCRSDPVSSHLPTTLTCFLNLTAVHCTQ